MCSPRSTARERSTVGNSKNRQVFAEFRQPARAAVGPGEGREGHERGEIDPHRDAREAFAGDAGLPEHQQDQGREEGNDERPRTPEDGASHPEPLLGAPGFLLDPIEGGDHRALGSLSLSLFRFRLRRRTRDKVPSLAALTS
jgi:hypothetical protein